MACLLLNKPGRQLKNTQWKISRPGEKSANLVTFSRRLGEDILIPPGLLQRGGLDKGLRLYHTLHKDILL